MAKANYTLLTDYSDDDHGLASPSSSSSRSPGLSRPAHTPILPSPKRSRCSRWLALSSLALAMLLAIYKLDLVQPDRVTSIPTTWWNNDDIDDIDGGMVIVAEPESNPTFSDDMMVDPDSIDSAAAVVLHIPETDTADGIVDVNTNLDPAVVEALEEATEDDADDSTASSTDIVNPDYKVDNLVDVGEVMMDDVGADEPLVVDDTPEAPFDDSPTLSSSASTSASSSSLVLSPSRPFRPQFDYFEGDWEFTMTPISDPKNNQCPVADKHDQSKKAVKKNKQRAKNTLRWSWTPQGPTDWWKWSEEEFMSRLLRSSMGLLIIGDSLSGQNYLVARSFFGSLSARLPSGTPLFVRPSSRYVVHYPTAFPTQFKGAHEALFLNPDAARILYPKLDRSRVDRPLVTFIRADYLLHKSELVEMLADQIEDAAVHDDDIENETPDSDTYNELQVRKDQELPEQWRYWIEYWLRDNPWRPVDGSIPERSVVLFNTGAHWTKYGRFSVSRATGSNSPLTHAEEMKVLTELYTRVAHVVVDFFSTFSQDLHIVYRTLSPGHPYCTSNPVQSVPTFLLSISGAAVGRAGKSKTSVWDEYGWERFKTLDDVWRTMWEKVVIEQETKPGGGPGDVLAYRPWKIDVMEVRDQAAGRGDAHNGAFKGDCLHWCLPTIPYQWMVGLGTVVLEKGR